LRATLPEDRLPPAVLREVPRVEIQDQPRDVMVFRGNEIWHGRENAANTVMLYFKLNAFHSDPLGEDPRTEAFRRQTERLADLPDEQLVEQTAVLARRVDYLHRRFNRHWHEVPGVVLSGEPHLTVSEDEWQLLRSLDGRRPLSEIFPALAEPSRHAGFLAGVRRLARRGVIDLLPAVPLARTNGAAVPVATTTAFAAGRTD
jgi:hypothetical protein